MDPWRCNLAIAARRTSSEMPSGGSNGAVQTLTAALRREVAAEFATTVEFAVYLQPPLVSQQDMLDDGEPKACSTSGTGATGIHAVETFGEARYVVRRNTYSRIRD